MTALLIVACDARSVVIPFDVTGFSGDVMLR